MVEPAMYFGIGFLVAVLLTLGVIPLVHARAIRLTMKRLEAATPLSMAEIQADKDQLRAEFAMSTRRLEMSLEQLKAKTTGQLAEIGKKSDAVNRLKFELGEKSASLFALEAREKALRGQLRETEEEFAAKTEALRNAERNLSDKNAEMAKLAVSLSDASMSADSRQIELVALRTQIDALKQRVSDAEKDLSSTGERLNQERNEASSAGEKLNAARVEIEGLKKRSGDLEHQLSLQMRETELLNSRLTDLENRLATQGKVLAEREYENNLLKQQLTTAQKTESELREALNNSARNPATDKMREEKAALEVQVREAREAQAKAQSTMNAMQKEAESSWASERMENALLRERINDVAAEVAKLAATLEGEDSPITAMLSGDPSALKDAARSAINTSRNGAPTASMATAGAADVVGGTLAERIKALQAQASKMRPAT